MFRKILVPLDGSELAERALETALTLAREAEGQITLLSVPTLRYVFVTQPASYQTPIPDDSFEKSREELLLYLHTVQEDKEHLGVDIRTEVVNGDAASVIVDTAAEQTVDLIAMCTHGRSGLTRWMLGSITERVLRGAPCPVLVVRTDALGSKILITLDGSELAEQALGPGFHLARAIGGHVTLLHVARELTHSEQDRLDELESGLGRRLLQDAEAYLQSIRQRFSRRGESVRTLVKTGLAAPQILETIESEKMDLVVMATHGFSGLRRWVYGSVTEKILRGANCALLVVRPQQGK